MNLNNEKGSAIVIAMLVLVSLTIIGIATIRTSTTELLITGNDIVKKISFFNSDAGISSVAKLISRAVNFKQIPVIDTFSIEPDFYQEISGFSTGEDSYSVAEINDDIHDAEVEVRRIGSFNLAGGGAEFASGAEGHATSIRGIRFSLDSFGEAEKNALTQIQARYLKVLGTAGGL